VNLKSDTKEETYVYNTLLKEDYGIKKLKFLLQWILSLILCLILTASVVSNHIKPFGTWESIVCIV